MSVKKEELSRRDKFAALAMQALIAKGGNSTHQEIADYAVKQADSLIRALERKA